MKVYAATDIGRVRPINEDSYYAPKPGEYFCAVADGMGGHNAGEVASAMAIHARFEIFFMRPPPFCREAGWQNSRSAACPPP